ncbi:breast cancer type 2 susceptibility protein homolog, partial [Rhinatrema bivittatum]|uniref:breast cancer type 2 susceptibility protein homolog n=1 Tax=Rhinatrema bivittatum TaxID=194408 RepID=UPI00112D4458
MAIEREERPSFFELFNACCSNADLGPISLNWFEELTAEALPYNPKTSEETEYKTDLPYNYGFKTPKRKQPMCSQLASTPRIFKELPLTSPPFSSPIKKLCQRRSEEGNEKTDGKMQIMSPFIARTKPVLPDDDFSSRNSSLNESPAVVRDMYRTPWHDEHLYSTSQQYMKSDVPGSLFCTPKFLSTETPKCISESLGAEVDPEMSWSSSLATPPTLAATVIIAKGNDLLGARPLDNRTAYVVSSLFSKRKESPEKTDIIRPSKSENENLNVEYDMKSQELEKDAFQNGLYCATNSARKQTVSNALDNGDMHQTTADVLEGVDEDLSIFFTSGKPASLRKVENGSKVEKNHSDKRSQEPVSMSQEEDKDVCFEKLKTQLNSSCNSSQKNVPEDTVENETAESKLIREYVQSLTSEWSQLNLSGLDITQMEEMPKYITSSSINLIIRKTEEKIITSKDTNNLSNLDDAGSPQLRKMLNINTLENIEDETNSSQLRKDAVLKQAVQDTPLLESLSLDHQNSTLVKRQISKMNLDMNLLDKLARDLEKGYDVCEHVFKNQSMETCKICKSITVSDDTIPLSCTSDVRGAICSRNTKDVATRSSLKGKCMLPRLIKQPKKFIYCVNEFPGHRQGTISKDLKSSTYCALSHLKFKPHSSDIPFAKKGDQDVCGVSADSLHLRLDICTEKNPETQSINAFGMDDTFNEYNSLIDQIRYQELKKSELKTIKKQQQIRENSSLASSLISTLVSKQNLDVSNNRIGSTIKQKVLAAAYLLAEKHLQMEYSRKEVLIRCPKKDPGLLNATVDSTNTFPILISLDMDGEITSNSSRVSEPSENLEYKPPKETCDFSSSLQEIGYEENKQKRICFKKETANFDPIASHLKQLPSGGYEEIISPCFEMLSGTSDRAVMLETENTLDKNPLPKESLVKQQCGFSMSSHNKNMLISLQTANIKSMSVSSAPIEKGKQIFDHIESGYLNEVISANLSLVKQESIVEYPQTVFSVPQKESGSTIAQKVKLLNSLPKVQEFSEKNKHVKSVTSFPSLCTSSDKASSSSETYLDLNLPAGGVEAVENTSSKQDLYCLLSCNANQNFVGFKTASNKQIQLSENSMKKSKMMFKEIEDQCLMNKRDEKAANKENSYFLPSSNISVLNLQFDSFNTTSSKQIQVSENINKGKLLLKEIEDQSLSIFLQEQMESISTFTGQDNVVTLSVAENKLATNSSCSTALQISHSETRNLVSNTTVTSTREIDSAVQDLPVKQIPELSQSLTASQKAEITELSSILEETNSQFEFTQFSKKIDMMADVSELVEDLESTANLNNSEVWKEINFDDSFNTESFITMDTWPASQVYMNEERICVENKDTKVNVSHAGTPVITLSKPVDTFFPNNSSTNFGGFSSASGKKINISNEVFLKAVKVFSDVDDVEESFLTPVSGCSNVTAGLNHAFSSQRNSMCQMGKNSYCISNLTKKNSKHQYHPKSNSAAEAINQFPARNIENKSKIMDEEKKRSCISSGKDIKDYSLKDALSIYNEDSSSRKHIVDKVGSRKSLNHQHSSLKNLNQFDPEKNSSECSLQAAWMHSVACFTKTAEVKEKYDVNISSEIPRETEQLKVEQNRPRVEPSKLFHMQPGFQTAYGRNISVSTASLEKAFHLFAEEYYENSSNSSLFSNELIANQVKMLPVAMECYTGKNKVSGVKETDLDDLKDKQIVQQKDHANQGVQENISMGFCTASGKKVTITDESLAKAKSLFAEESILGIHNQTTSEADDYLQPGFKKGDENLNDRVCKTFGKTSSKYCGEMLQLQGDNGGKHSVCEGSVKILEKKLNGSVYHATDFETEHTLSLEANSTTLPKKNLESLNIKNLSVMPSTKAFRGFQTGQGKLISVSEVSLLKARKLLNEDSLKRTPLKIGDASTTAFCRASTEETSEKHPSPMSTGLAIKVDKPFLKDIRGLANETDSCFSRTNSEIDYVNNLDDSDCKLNHSTKNMPTVFQNQSMDVCTMPRKRVTASEEALESDICNMNNLDLSNAENVAMSQNFVFGEGPLITEKERVNLRPLNTGPAVFSTAGGKTVSISHEALKRARQIFSDEKSIDTNIETKFQTEVPASSKLSGSSEYLTQVKGKNADSSCCFSTAKGEAICINEKSLKYVRNMFADTLSKQINAEPQKVEKHIYENHAVTVSHLDTSENKPGFFSTASGKHVQLSDESLKKARRLFSEIENNYSLEQQGVLALDYQCKEPLLGNKETKFPGEENRLVNIRSERQVPQDPDISTTIGNPKSSLGFSTASGTPVIVSENALQNVKIMFKEFDSGNSDSFLESTSCFTVTKVNKTEYQELGKDILAAKGKETQQNDGYINMKSSRNMHVTKIPNCMPYIDKSKQLTAVLEASTTFSTKHHVLDDKQQQYVRPETKTDLASVNVPPKATLKIYSTTSAQNPENYLEKEAVESAKAFMEDDELTDAGLVCEQNKSHSRTDDLRNGKRKRAEGTFSEEPTIKRQLLPEFDRSMKNCPKPSLKALGTPDGMTFFIMIIITTNTKFKMFNS